MPIVKPALSGTVLPKAAVLVSGSEAYKLYETLLRSLNLMTAATATGLMQSAHHKALIYATERYQGGKKIIDHSHLRGILGSMSAAVRTSNGLVRHGAQHPTNGLIALSAKLSATAAAQQTCTDAVQILGGYGYMRDFGLEKMMRDAAVLTLLPISNARTELLITVAEKELFV